MSYQEESGKMLDAIHAANRVLETEHPGACLFVTGYPGARTAHVCVMVDDEEFHVKATREGWEEAIGDAMYKFLRTGM